jgi:hypothetical protein
MPLLQLTTGDGTFEYVSVNYWAQFPRWKDSTCAYCHGDPCNENSPPTSTIARYYARNPHAETCPVCDGRPT